MMGHRIHARPAYFVAKRFKFFPLTGRDTLVHGDHFFRPLEAQLDLSFVRDLVRGGYQELGQSFIEPAVFGVSVPDGRPWALCGERSAPREPIIKQRRPASTLNCQNKKRLDQGIS